MKRYGNLYQKVCSLENIRLAHKNAKKGKGHYSEVKMVEADPEKYFLMIQEMLRNKMFKTLTYSVFTKVDQKKVREIYKLPYFPDRIVHHCIMNILEPIWMKTLISDTYASLKGRGIHKGVKRMKRALKDTENTTFCLKMDVKKFYPSINHNVLKRIIRKKIKDPDLLWLLDEIIDSADGVPIGNYLSQYFGNLYLSGFDHWMKESKSIKYYFRYCDDVIILSTSKRHLGELREQIQHYLLENLRLTLKGNWQIFPVRVRGIDFLGYRFFGYYTLLRKGIVRRFKLKVYQIKKDNCKLSLAQIVNGIMSYYGWLKYCSCYRLWKSWIDSEIKSILDRVCCINSVRNPLEANHGIRV
jgi:RNA-directed DNA polymerase